MDYVNFLLLLVILAITFVRSNGDNVVPVGECDALEDAIDRKNDILRQAAEQFQTYAHNHFAKDTREATEKGIVNMDWCRMLLREAERDQ